MITLSEILKYGDIVLICRKNGQYYVEYTFFDKYHIPGEKIGSWGNTLKEAVDKLLSRFV